MTQVVYKNFKFDIDAEKILWLGVDREQSKVNSLNRALFAEFDHILNEIHNLDIIGVVIYSAKEKGFIAGADITQFTALKTKEEAFDLIRQAQLILDKLEGLKVPTLAMIDGFCLGGGLELALACRYRIAADIPGTLIGLPEVKLGIHPGWGGTVRLPRLIGAIEAMKMILPGEAYPAKKAAKIGIIDEALPLRELKRAARYYIIKQPKKHTPSFIQQMTNAEMIRSALAKVFFHQLKSKNVTAEQYPAPYAVVKNWVRYGVTHEAYLQEAHSIAELMMTGTSRNLVRLFFLQDKLKGLAKGAAFKPRYVHVIGAGIMGGDIAAWCAYKGATVTLQDQTADKIAPAIRRAAELFQKKLREPRLVQNTLDRLIPDTQGEGVKRADVVIEAVFENLAVKQELFAKVEPQLKPDALLATNTSSLPLEQISGRLSDPARLIGAHFFNPVAKMMLVEVVKGEKTSPEMVQKGIAWVTQLSRLPLPVKSTPGFLVNRVLMPYLLEAMELYQENISPYWIDQAAIRFGMPMGPVTLADKVGLDICLSVAENLVQYFGGTVPKALKKMVAEKRLGVKSGHGFYRYHRGKALIPSKGTEPAHMNEITDRLVLRLLNEAVACLREKVVDEADYVDAGMVFGTGFAPFRGGPIQYARTRGPSEIVARLEEFTQKYGPRFKPDSGWNSI